LINKIKHGEKFENIAKRFLFKKVKGLKLKHQVFPVYQDLNNKKTFVAKTGFRGLTAILSVPLRINTV